MCSRLFLYSLFWMYSAYKLRALLSSSLMLKNFHTDDMCVRDVNHCVAHVCKSDREIIVYMRLIGHGPSAKNSPVSIGAPLNILYLIYRFTDYSLCICDLQQFSSKTCLSRHLNEILTTSSVSDGRILIPHSSRSNI